MIDRYLAKEVWLGKVAGPVLCSEHPTVHIYRFGVIPKPHQPGQFRLILDLSHPQGASVNDGIEPELCSLKYTSVGEAVKKVKAMEPGAHLTKVDIESAYRIVPVHPEDRMLLGMEWKGKLYIDMALPFGLPKFSTPWRMPCSGFCKGRVLSPYIIWMTSLYLVLQTRRLA